MFTIYFILYKIHHSNSNRREKLFFVLNWNLVVKTNLFSKIRNLKLSMLKFQKDFSSRIISEIEITSFIYYR